MRSALNDAYTWWLSKTYLCDAAGAAATHDRTCTSRAKHTAMAWALCACKICIFLSDCKCTCGTWERTVVGISVYGRRDGDKPLPYVSKNRPHVYTWPVLTSLYSCLVVYSHLRCYMVAAIGRSMRGAAAKTPRSTAAVTVASRSMGPHSGLGIVDGGFVAHQCVRQGPLCRHPLEEQVEGRQDVTRRVWWQLVKSVQQLLDIATE